MSTPKKENNSYLPKACSPVPMKLTTEEAALIIRLLEERRIYFESRNREVAKQASELINKISKDLYK